MRTFKTDSPIWSRLLDSKGKYWAKSFAHDTDGLQKALRDLVALPQAATGLSDALGSQKQAWAQMRYTSSVSKSGVSGNDYKHLHSAYENFRSSVEDGDASQD